MKLEAAQTAGSKIFLWCLGSLAVPVQVWGEEAGFGFKTKISCNCAGAWHIHGKLAPGQAL
jgi:hypothetical protein